MIGLEESRGPDPLGRTKEEARVAEPFQKTAQEDQRLTG